MKEKHTKEFQKFDTVMKGLLAVPYGELQEKLEKEKREKERHSTSNDARASVKKGKKS